MPDTKEYDEAILRLQLSREQQIPWEHPCYARTDGMSPMMKWQCDCFHVARRFFHLSTAVGTVLDHWDQLPSDVRSDSGFQHLGSALCGLSRVMKGDEP